MNQASGSSYHAGSERTRHSHTGDHLCQVGSQSERNWSVGVQLSRGVVHIKLEVGDVHEARVLVDVENVRVESAQVKNILNKPSQSKLKSDHLSECPVIGGRLEGGHGPLLQHGPGHHAALHLLQYLPQHLVTGLAAPGLHCAQSLVVSRDGVVVILLSLDTSPLVDAQQALTVRIVLDQSHLR